MVYLSMYIYHKKQLSVGDFEGFPIKILWVGNTVDGSEIRRSPVEVGNLSRY